jgi:methylphosphotriester-DNA--protein-cysteine methyltransferase
VDSGHRRLYNALTARDARFDGLFFVGVTSTRVYCRPICPVKTPKAANCRFFETPHEAEHAGFRPCLRCRPELTRHRFSSLRRFNHAFRLRYDMAPTRLRRSAGGGTLGD